MASSNTDSRWGARISRARYLASRFPEAREALEFLADISGLQERLAERHREAATALPECLAWLADHGPETIARAGSEIARAGTAWHPLLTSYESDTADAALAFVVEILLQAFPGGRCPSCDKPPAVSLLREAGHGARRSVICGVCLSERPAARLGCAACGETKVESLPVYQSESAAPARIDACDTCRSYTKTIDLTRDGSACPIADDIATISLDLWAREQGYHRARPNLLRL